MAFPEFGRRYAERLAACGGVERAAALAVMAQATNALAVFYCTDPYIPGYGKVAEILPESGCHRVVLADSVRRFFMERGVAVELFEADPTFSTCHIRSFPAALAAPVPHSP